VPIVELTEVVPYDDRTAAVIDLVLGHQYSPRELAALALACLEQAGMDRMDYRLVRDLLAANVDLVLPEWSYAAFCPQFESHDPPDGTCARCGCQLFEHRKVK